MRKTVGKIVLKLATAALVAVLAAPALAATACHNTASYESWLEQFKKEAAAQGISQKVIAAASPSLTFDPAIISATTARPYSSRPSCNSPTA